MHALIWTSVRSAFTRACHERNICRLDCLAWSHAQSRRRDIFRIASSSSFGIHTTTDNKDAILIRSATSSSLNSTKTPIASGSSTSSTLIRLSKLISQNAPCLTMSRREAERQIRSGMVTIAGETVTQPQLLVELDQVRFGALCVNGKAVKIVIHDNDNVDNGKQQEHQKQKQPTDAETKKTRVWLVNKLSGELVADSDEHDRPCLMQRLKHGGVGRSSNGRNNLHLKPIGRLDMTTEGLILVTNDGMYAREMELPSNHVHRTYRVRVHGLLTSHKSKRIQNGVTIDGIHYKGMRLEVENKNKRHIGERRTSGCTNKWLTITCTEGKNRQIRKVFEYLGLNVTRLIRISYGDYQLQTIPAGMAIEVPVKPVDKQHRRGKLTITNNNASITNTTATNSTSILERRSKPSAKRNKTTAPDDVTDETTTSTVQWVRHV